MRKGKNKLKNPPKTFECLECGKQTTTCYWKNTLGYRAYCRFCERTIQEVPVKISKVKYNTQNKTANSKVCEYCKGNYIPSQNMINLQKYCSGTCKQNQYIKRKRNKNE